MQGLRSGYLSSEFLLTVAVNVMAAYVAVDASRSTVQVVAALAIAAIKTAYYLRKRTELKMFVADPTSAASAAP